jgi:hypothetical protein
MANICSNTLEISGDTESIKKLYKLIESQDKEFVDEYFFLEKGNYYGIVEDTIETQAPYDYINLSTTTKWSPPLETLEALSALYPTLEFKIEWEERGCQVFGNATFKNGIGEVVDQAPLDYYIDNYGEVEEEYDRIQRITPEELLKELLDNLLEELSEEIDPPMVILQPVIAAKIKEEDLPLLINMEWSPEAMTIINRRLTHKK